MNSVVFNMVAFLIEITKVLLLSEVLLKTKEDKKIRIIVGVCIATMVVGGISIYYNYVYDFSLLCVIVALISIFWSITSSKNIAIMCLLYVGISIVDMVTGALAMMLFNINTDAFLKNDWLFLLVNCISLIFILIIVYYKNKIGPLNINISKGCVVLLISGGICLGLYISVLQMIGFNNAQTRQIKIAVLILSLVSITFIIIAAALIIKDNRNEQLMREAEINAELLKLQKDYYTMQLEKDEETKKFRHDIKNHIYCMQILLKDKEYDELNQYINKIYNNITNLKSNINTGNKLIDAIVANLENKYENIKIVWKGQLPENTKLSSMDVCTIFSNLLSNAFEASDKSQDKKVEVTVEKLELQLFITIKNQFDKTLNVTKGKIMTTKKGKNHGYGIGNAEKSIEENNGELKVKFSNNIFMAEILFYDIFE